jgi:hypothetical protein
VLALTVCGAQSALSQSVEPDETTKARLQPIVKGILAAWDKFDVICLGEGHGSKNDSDLRITLVENPEFARKVRTVIIEFADSLHQELLDRFFLEGEEIPREKLRDVWKNTSGREVWELPIYEGFLRAVQKVNVKLPKNQRIRVIGGDNSREENRGKFIRDAVADILSKRMKALAIYGSVHCENRGMGFPGELSAHYSRRIWSAAAFHFPDEARRIFNLSEEPVLIAITGTDKENLPAKGLFAPRNANDNATLHYRFDAIVFYGDLRSPKTNK